MPSEWLSELAGNSKAIHGIHDNRWKEGDVDVAALMLRRCSEGAENINYRRLKGFESRNEQKPLILGDAGHGCLVEDFGF